MTPQQLDELNELRRCLSRSSSIDREDLMGLFSDFIHNSDLRGKLYNTSFSEAVVYCFTYKSYDRVVVINKLFDWLVTQQRVMEAEAQSMTEIALFVGGVDGQLNDISALIQRKTTPVTSAAGFKSNFGSGFGGNSSRTGSSKSPTVKPWLIILLATIALLLVILLVSKCQKDTTPEPFSVIDVCRAYDGTINSQTTKTCKMSVSIIGNGEMKVVLTNIYNPKDVSTYTSIIKNGELVLTGGPNLQISKTTKGNMVLSCDHKKYGKWFFKSK